MSLTLLCAGALISLLGDAKRIVFSPANIPIPRQDKVIGLLPFWNIVV